MEKQWNQCHTLFFWAPKSLQMVIAAMKLKDAYVIPVELFQILKDDAVKVFHTICQQIWKLSSGHRTGKVSFHRNPKERQWQTMLKLLHNCTHLTR